MIKAVFLDIDNTLLDFDLCVSKAMQDGLARHKIEFREEMFGTFKSVNDALWRRIEEGTLTREELMRVRWKLIFEKLGIDLDGPKFEEYFRAQLHESAIPVDGAKEMLSYLSTKYRLFAASNGPYEQQRHRLEKAGMLGFFDELFVSSAIGFSKPMPEFFDHCFALAGVSPKESAIIGDSLTADITGGKAAGMKTIWFNKNGETETGGTEPDFTVASLYEIKNIL